MRGKVFFFDSQHLRIGITPAYAGKSARVHSSKIWKQGSPPPMRGKAPAYDPKQANNRITPAYAGKSILSVSAVLRTTGSPPPMRGKVVVVWQH